MVSQYELYLITKVGDDTSKKVLSAVKKLVDGKDGKILEEKEWGKKVLSYPINKESEGVYHLIQFTMEGLGVKEVTDKIKNTSGVIRHLILKGGPTKEEKKATRKAKNKKSK